MSDTNRKSKILSTGNRFHSPPSSSSSQSQHSTNKQKQQQQSSPLGIILGRPMTNGFDGRLYIPIFYPKSWIVPSTSVQRQPIRTIVPMQYSSSNSYHSYYSYPSKFLYSKINNPTPTMYRQSPAAFESFIGQTFQLPDKTTTLDTKTNTEMDHRHDPSSMSFILQQLDQNLLQQQYQETKQQQQINVEKNSKPTKKSFTNLLKSLGKFASISPSSSSTSSENTRSSSSEAMIADGSEQIEPYHPYPLKHIGGPYYVGPPILGIHDPDAELKLAMAASNNVLDQNGDGFMDNFLMNTAENTMDDTSDDVNSYYYGLEHADNEFTTPTLIDQFNPSTSSILSRTESNIQTPLESNRISISSIKSNRTIRNNLNRQSRKKFKTTSKPNYSYQEETTLNPLKSVIEPSSSSSSWKAIISTTTTTTSTTTESPFNKNSMIPLNISNISPQSQWIPTVAARKHNSLKDTNVFKFPISF
uniref:Uncharacterized protein LOC113797986 n=1 Tax=Dermatophagoides pteronyssinus TaxID=6956 RepID=A0A6P6YHK0_DERPT|nr:uncharacterized protein LOC113797986 [Dermatophagoides pteronyssinus]